MESLFDERMTRSDLEFTIHGHMMGEKLLEFHFN
jgi:hypothetical protein